TDKALKSFAIDLSGNPGFGQLLNQARGEQVEVTLQPAGNQPTTLTGSVLGGGKVKQSAGKDSAAEVDLLNLWCKEGVRNLPLREVQRLRFLNPTLESEVRRA